MAANDVAFEVSEARRIDAALWRADSLCKKYPTKLWFAGGTHETVLAKGICAGCSVQVSCLEFALARPDLLGVWAATTPNERAALRRSRRAAANGGGAHEPVEPAEAAAVRVRVEAPYVRADAAFRVADEPTPEIRREREREPIRRPDRSRRRSAALDDRGAGNELFTPAEAARRLGVTPNTVTRWSRAGKIAAIQTMGGHRRFRRDEVERILREASLVVPEREAF